MSLKRVPHGLLTAANFLVHVWNAQFEMQGPDCFSERSDLLWETFFHLKLKTGWKTQLADR